MEESEILDLQAAEARYDILKERFGAAVGLVHGRMKVDEKDAVMAAFARGDIKILVATTVIEVGVNIPEANIMVIEQAERFGLSQLHQLRGRVGRGAAKSFCFLVYAAGIGKTANGRGGLRGLVNIAKTAHRKKGGDFSPFCIDNLG